MGCVQSNASTEQGRVRAMTFSTGGSEDDLQVFKIPIRRPSVAERLNGDKGGIGLTLAEIKGEQLGAYISTVDSSGAAQRAGVKPGLVIIEIDGRDVRFAAFDVILDAMRPRAETVTIVCVQDGHPILQKSASNKLELDNGKVDANTVPFPSLNKQKAHVPLSAQLAPRSETSGWYVRYEGPLCRTKRSTGFKKSVKLRHFILKQEPLTGDCELEYYDGKKFAGSMALGAGRVKPGLGGTFSVRGIDREWHLAVPKNDSSLALAWTDAIHSALARRKNARSAHLAAIQKGENGSRDQMGEESSTDGPSFFTSAPAVRPGAPQGSQRQWSLSLKKYEPTLLLDTDGPDEGYDECHSARDFAFNTIDLQGVDRTSRSGKYGIDPVHGLPLNPLGRTGAARRGILPRYGPNHAGAAIVARWTDPEQGPGSTESGDGGTLEILAIRHSWVPRRGSSASIGAGVSGEAWLIPEELVFRGEHASVTASRATLALALSSGSNVSEMWMDRVFDGRVESFVGLSGDADCRNSDNAWVELTCYTFTDTVSPTPFEWVRLRPGAFWATYKPGLSGPAERLIPMLNTTYDFLADRWREDHNLRKQDLSRSSSGALRPLSMRYPSEDDLTCGTDQNGSTTTTTTTRKTEIYDKLDVVENVIEQSLYAPLGTPPGTLPKEPVIEESSGSQVVSGRVATEVLGTPVSTLRSSAILDRNHRDSALEINTALADLSSRDRLESDSNTDESIIVSPLHGLNSKINAVVDPSIRTYDVCQSQQVVVNNIQDRVSPVQKAVSSESTVQSPQTSEKEIAHLVHRHSVLHIAEDEGEDKDSEENIRRELENKLRARCLELIAVAVEKAPELAATDREHKIFIANADYTTEEVDEFSILRGDELIVHREDEDGWWLASRIVDGSLGYLPAPFLTSAEDPKALKIYGDSGIRPRIASVRA